MNEIMHNTFLPQSKITPQVMADLLVENRKRHMQI